MIGVGGGGSFRASYPLPPPKLGTLSYAQGRDAAFPRNLQGWGGVVLGYYGGAGAFNVWAPSAWAMFPRNPKIPIWVPPTGPKDGTTDGIDAVHALRDLKVPPGKVTMADMETMKDRTYLENFGAELQGAGYKVWVYGSVSTLFQNPALNGYAVADPTGILHMYPHPSVRMTQWAFGPATDQDAIKEWLLAQDDIWI